MNLIRPTMQRMLSLLSAVVAAVAVAACSENPVDDPVLVSANNRGVGLMGQYLYEKALAAFDEVLASEPGWLDVKVNQAIATLNRQQEGDEQRALAILSEVLRDDPGHVRAHYGSGLLKLHEGDPTAALPHFRFAAEQRPQDAYAAYFVAQCLEQADDTAGAFQWYEKAVAIDPYLRSGYYRLSQLGRRLGKLDLAEQMQRAYDKLEKNPRARLVEFKYTRMGPLGEAAVVGTADPKPVAPPQGPLFTEARALPIVDGDALKWRQWTEGDRPSITVCDINGDDQLDVFIADAFAPESPVRNAVLLKHGDAYRMVMAETLGAVTDVNAALWGDYDNDGLTDVYLCRRGPNQLWRQVQPQQWHNVTEATGTAGTALNTVDGAMFDADHDGDLDIFTVNADGSNELFNNNLDGTFRPLAASQGIAGAGQGSRQVLIADVDDDRDMDIIVINNQPPHDVWLNDRLWNYRSADGFEAFKAAPIVAAVAADRDVDGQTEIYAINRNGEMVGWTPDDRHVWNPTQLAKGGTGVAAAAPQLAALDVTGSGRVDLIRTESRGVGVYSPSASGGLAPAFATAVTMPLAGWATALLSAREGPSLIALPAVTDRGSAPIALNPGAGRFEFVPVQFSGRKDPNETMRSNSSGIGTQAAARVGSNWSAVTIGRDNAGPGQSLQPVAFGLGGAPAIDFVAIDWSDGVYQTELGLESGKLHTIVEEQRQVSSCPVLFVWNGERFEFVSDLLGVGGLGYMVAPGEYAPPRPRESFLLPEGLAQPRNGRFQLKVAEPMEEACYLDHLALVAYDLPPGWSMTLDERMNIAGLEPTGEPRFYRYELVPVRAVNDRGDDVASLVIVADHVAAPVGEVDHRFIGRLAREHVLTVEFDRPIDQPPADAPGARPILVIDGWIEYPYSQTMFAAWQAKASYDAPTLEARGDDGQWLTVQEHFGYPAGMPRQMSVPLDGLPRGTAALRLRTNQEIMWDRLAIAYAEPCPAARVTGLPLVAADLEQRGFAHRTSGPQRLPQYDYQRRVPLWDCKVLSGWYTAYGSVLPLLANSDGGLAIFGSGEEVQAEFDGSAMIPLPPGWTRFIVLESVGWCKDMDLYTQHGETLEPLPGGKSSSDAFTLHNQYNTRHHSGR
jgi:hypothetical protein